MKKYLDPIFNAATQVEACLELQRTIESLKAMNYFDSIPIDYEDISSSDSMDVQDWFDVMKSDERTENEHNLRELFGLYQATLSRLRELGFHRE